MTASVKRRSAVHAALGEPVRLAIADALFLGDVSPGELAQRFSLATNLLAHHLRVLQDAGVIRRVPSDADRRRSYVQLCLDDAVVRASAGEGDVTLPVGSGGAARVVFVCTANSARSQLAAASWNRISDLPATSAGTHPAARVHPRAVVVGRRHGLRLGRATTSSVAGLLHADDLVVAVCDNAHEELAHDVPRLHWAIPDPVPTDTDAAFEGAYDDITRRVKQLVDAVTHRP